MNVKALEQPHFLRVAKVQWKKMCVTFVRQRAVKKTDSTKK